MVFRKTARYGIDAPELTKSFVAASAILTATAWFESNFRFWGQVIAIILLAVSFVCLLFSLSLIAYAARGKFNIRDRILSYIKWKGDEQVLDIGTGRGLLMVGAAKRLTSGKVVGIDIWRREDLTGNHPKHTVRNLTLEGVHQRSKLKTECVTKLSFPDNSFNVVLSLLCLNALHDRKMRTTACQQIARVLKPGGTAVLADYIGTRGFAKTLREAGLTVHSHTMHVWESYSLLHILVVTKKEALPVVDPIPVPCQ